MHSWVNSLSNMDKWFTEWLYGEYDEGKYNTAVFLHSFPIIGNYMDYLLDVRAGKEYLNRHGMDYTDIHDFRKLLGSNSGSTYYRSVVNYVSSNIGRLYR